MTFGFLRGTGCQLVYVGQVANLPSASDFHRFKVWQPAP
jgi:hypothetical protein